LPEAKRESISIHAIVKGVASLFHQPGVCEIKLLLDAKNDYVLADKDQMTRVFTNIVGNAIEAIPKGKMGQIAISSISDNGQLRIEISDNGVGIEPEQISKIFEPNFTTKSGGTGLGLAMVKRIVQHTQGKVKVESDAKSGSTFILLLPLIKKL
jgi:signal transduction histidine kinase